MKPLYLTSKTDNNYLPDKDMPTWPSGERKEKNIILSPVKCFERMIRKNTRCHSCFYPSIATATIVKFKNVAYTLVRNDAGKDHNGMLDNVYIYVRSSKYFSITLPW